MVEATPAPEPRSARCSRHGRIYDRRSIAGCPACAADLAALPPLPVAPSRRGSTLLLALIATMLLLVWYQPEGFAPALDSSSSEGIPAAAEAVVDTSAGSRSGRIDPNPYRALIESIEAVLYRPATTGAGDCEQVAVLSRRLGERLYAELGPLRGRRALLELATFGSEVEAGTEIGYATPSLDAPRASWEALRATLFRSAKWLRHTDAELVVAQRPEPRRVPVRDLLTLRSYANEIEAMVQGGRGALMQLREQGVDVAEGSREERELLIRFRSFAEEWDARVRALQQRFPAPPPLDGEQHVVFAHQALGQALHQISLATTPVGDYAVPMKWWRQQCLDAAAAQWTEARQQLQRAAQTTGLAEGRSPVR